LNDADIVVKLRFEITLEELQSGEEVATCPSCSLLVRVIYDPDDFLQEESKSVSASDNLRATA